MVNIKILGGGCSSCKTAYNLIEEVSKELGVEVALEKVEDMQVIMSYDVMSTPAVVIDEAVVHRGGIPSRKRIKGWLS